MKYFAGLDVSLEKTSICIVDERGRIVKEFRPASEPEALIAALRITGLPLERIGLEACSLTAWLHEGLTQAGLLAICIETRQASAAMKTMPNKTTSTARAPSRRLCGRVASDRCMSKVGKAVCGARSLLHAAQSSTRCDRSKTWCGRSYGKSGSSLTRRAGWILLNAPANGRWRFRGDAAGRALFATLATRLREFARLTKHVLDLARKEKVCRQLLSVPGIGPIPRSPFAPRSTGRIVSNIRETSARISG